MKTFVVVESVPLVKFLLAEVTGILLDTVVHVHVVLHDADKKVREF